MRADPLMISDLEPVTIPNIIKVVITHMDTMDITENTEAKDFAMEGFAREDFYEERRLSQPLLAWMSFIKLGDFILLTPSLREIQKYYPGLVVAVPDLLWDLYCEADIFTKAIPSSAVERFLNTSEEQPLILDLTYPLLDKVHVPENHWRLDAEAFMAPVHSTQAYQQALRAYFPELPLDFQSQPFMDLNPNVEILRRHEVKPFYYFTVHTGSDFVPKNWSPQSFETTVEIILEKHPEIICLCLVGPNDTELFEEREAPSNFRTVRTGIQEVAHLLAGSLFHIDNDSGIHHLAGALDVPSITVFGPTGPGTWCSMTKRNFIHWGGSNCPHHCGGSKMVECKEKICLTSVKPAFLAESAERILAAYNHL